MLSLFAMPLDTQRRGRFSSLRAYRVLFVLLIITLGAQLETAAVPISNYRARIHQAAIQLASLEQWAKVDTPVTFTERVATTLNDVRKAIPADETVEWDGASLHVNNSWLSAEIQAYEKMTIYDSRRIVVLKQMAERLRALDDRLEELDTRKGTTVATTSKDQEKARLEAIMRREEFAEKPQEKNIFQRAWERFKAWLNNLFPGSSLEPGRMSWLSFIAMILVFGLAGFVLGYAIWKLIPFLQRRRAKFKLEPRQARIVLGERLAPNQTAADLLAEAEALARRGELRAAIRKAYIALLCELGDRKVLTLAQHKTNRDYLRAMREKRPLLDEMQRLTSSFENHWYGFRQTTADDWTAFRSGYEKVLSTE